jgi:hypothetical protein
MWSWSFTHRLEKSKTHVCIPQTFSKSNAYVNEETYFYHAQMQGDDNGINCNNILLEMLVYFNLKL